MTRRIVSAIVMAVIIAISCHAQYRIVFLNTPSILIGGKSLKAGDTFSPDAPIKWNSPRQAMKVVDMASKSQRLIVAEQYEKSECNNLKSFISQTKHLSSRNGAPTNPVELRALLDGHFYLTDTLKVATAMPTDKNRFFYISYSYAGEDINKIIENRDGTFFITPDIFTIDGKPIPPFDATLSVYYLDQSNEKVTLITDSMQITLIPATLE